MKTLTKKFKEWALGKSAYNEKGEEIPDPTPLEMPVGFEKPQTLSDIMAQMLHAEVQRELHKNGLETFDEADDFDVPEDDPIEAPWQDPMTGEIWTREAEMKAGQVEIPDFHSAKALAKKAQDFLDKKNAAHVEVKKENA